MMKKITCLVLALVMMVCSLPFVNAKMVSAATDTVTVKFINVTTAGSGKKGDAALINYAGKYYLVDTGCGDSYGKATDPLTKEMQILANQGIKLSGIILTHNHEDHVGALAPLINTKLTNTKGKKVSVVNTGTTLYYNAASASTTYMKEGKAAAVAKGMPCKAVQKKTVVNALTGNVRTPASNGKYVSYGSDGLFIYGSAYNPNGQTGTTVQNNLSMIVQVKKGTYDGIFLGDLCKTGLEAMMAFYTWDKYALFGLGYTFCSVGHHAMRSSGAASVNAEMALYKASIRANNYVLTVNPSQKNLTDPTSAYYKNHQSIKTTLATVGKVYYSNAGLTFVSN